MNWFRWALLAVFFAGVAAVLAKAGPGRSSRIWRRRRAAIRTTVVLALALGIVIASGKLE